MRKWRSPLVPTSSHGRGSRGTGPHSACTAAPCRAPLPPAEKHSTDARQTTGKRAHLATRAQASACWRELLRLHQQRAQLSGTEQRVHDPSNTPAPSAHVCVCVPLVLEMGGRKQDESCTLSLSMQSLCLHFLFFSTWLFVCKCENSLKAASRKKKGVFTRCL